MEESPTSLTTLYQGASSVAYSNPLIYQNQQQADQAATAYANNINYWKGVYPFVELSAVDNPDVDYRLFTLPWQASYGNPPMVFLSVTPRKKELPKTSDVLTDIAPVLGPILSIIPVVGTVLSLALSIAAGSDKASRVKQFMQAATSVTNSEFEPQYYPNAFPVLLPLDWAQIAVKEPWKLPGLWDTFKHQIQEAQRAATEELLGKPSTLTLSADLNPTVLQVTPPGQEAPGTDQWYQDLLTQFHQSTDYSLQYKELQNTWLTGNASGNPVAAAASGSSAASAAADAGNPSTLLWLAVAGIGAVVLAH